jgi:hypothetical protein
LLGHGSFCGKQSIECKQCLDDAGFHIENARAEYFGCVCAERHFCERAGSVDGVIVAEDEELEFWRSGFRTPNNADVIAA